MAKASDRVTQLAERIAIHIEAGRIGLAHRLVDEATVLDCVQPYSPAESLAIAELPGVPVEIVNHLERAGLLYLGDLVQRRPGDLLEVPGVGPAAISKLVQAAKEAGLQWAKTNRKRQSSVSPAARRAARSSCPGLAAAVPVTASRCSEEASDVGAASDC